MPTVTGKVAKPDLSAKDVTSVTMELVDGNGNPVRAFRTSTDETIVGPQPLTLTNGSYSVVLPGNVDLNPAGTRYRRRIYLPGGSTVDDLLIVPATAGPYTEEDILASPLVPVPTATPSNEIAHAVRTTSPGGLVTNGLNMVAVPLLVITIPDLDRPVWVWAQNYMTSNTANVNVGTTIALVGSTLGQQVGIAQSFVGATGKVGAPVAWARLPAHSPGDYQSFVTGDASTITLTAGAFHRIGALAV